MVNDTSATENAVTRLADQEGGRAAGGGRRGCNAFDCLVVWAVLVGGWLYHANCSYWSQEQIGGSPFGDAEFWWNGAVHMARGLGGDHFGEGYRVGYFFLAGFPTALFDWTFPQFHQFFVPLCLAVCAWFYLTLRAVLGRVAAAAAIVAIVFNPFAAEWTATSTTDAAGSALNMAMLCLLIGGLNGGLGWRLAGSGLLLSVANLTRPLMAPFAAASAVLLFLFLRGNLQTRLKHVLVFSLASAIPLLLWMAVQKAIVGEASVSQNDVSAMYAASDPKIQIWSPDIYAAVRQSASSRFRGQALTPVLLNGEFWRLTHENYAANVSYHLLRVLPQTWLIANFTSAMAPHRRLSLELTVFRVLVLLLILVALYKRSWRSALAGSGFLIASALPCAFGLFVLGGSMLPWLFAFRSRPDVPMVFLSAYWWTGVGALYLVGGAWGDFMHMQAHCTGLGYRLYDQFYFAGIVLAYYFAGRLISLSGSREMPRIPTFISMFVKERPALNRLCWAPLVALAIVLLLAELSGACLVGERTYERWHTVAKPFPDLQLIPQGREAAGDKRLSPLARAILSSASLVVSTTTNNPVPASRDGHQVDSGDVMMTGAGTEFIWNLAGQERASLILYQQADIRPFTMHPGRVTVDVPEETDRAYWRFKQGALVVRAVPTDAARPDNFYYVNRPALRAFIPLSGDRSGYDLEAAKWYQIKKYAADLVASGELTLVHCKMMRDDHRGEHAFARHFLLVPDQPMRSATLHLSLAHARGNASVAFKVEWNMPPSKDEKIKVVLTPYGKRRSMINDLDAANKRLSMQSSLADCGESVQIRFDGVPSTGVWIYELNLLADDFAY